MKLPFSTSRLYLFLSLPPLKNSGACIRTCGAQPGNENREQKKKKKKKRQKKESNKRVHLEELGI